MKYLKVTKFTYSIFAFLLFLSSSFADRKYSKDGFLDPVSFPISTSWIVVSIIFLSVYINRGIFIPKMKLSIYLIFIFFFTFVLITSFISIDSLEFTIKWIILQFLIIISILMTIKVFSKTNKLLDYFFTFILVYSSISILFAVYLFLVGSFDVGFTTMEHFPGYLRLYGWYGNPNDLGAIMGIASIVSLVLFFKNQNFLILKALLSIFMLTGVILTASKTFVIAVVFITIICLFIEIFPKLVLTAKIRKNSLIFVMISFFITLILIFIVITFYDYFTIAFNVSNFTTGSGRTLIWQDGIQYYLEGSIFQQLFGFGFDSYLNNIGISAHSFYFKHLIENGLFFILFFFMINIYFMYNMTKYFYSENIHLSMTAKFSFYIILFIMIANIGFISIFLAKIENFVYLFSIFYYFYIQYKFSKGTK